MRSSSEAITVGGLELELVRPAEPESLLDEDAFADDEFLPYWAELWPAGLALAGALPGDLVGADAWSSSAAALACRHSWPPRAARA